ncbi:DUF1963 domain-containing protein [Hymenobacter sp. RP-2-7]|uniref:DUF1963 domain-containing protein n=1 Tax=Hymenobacter polaris TaxID=2682546 RepID=A0A7Y0ABK7_9BACT|nr:YwqG family protein [Hymenobacter polaris]NML64324.1 DUF1963 domain-containing protein [Hymenobacter polaris]
METNQLDLQAAVEAAGLGFLWSRLAPHCRLSVRVLTQTAPEVPLPVGCSHLGGLPDLPVAAPWPTWQGRSLSFLAQLNLAELAAFPAAAPLPPAGVLSFFYDALEQPWGYDPADRGRAVVLYHPVGTELAPRPQPADLTTDEYEAFTVVPLTFAPELTLPDLREQDLGIAEEELSEQQWDAYWDIQHRYADGASRVLGHPDTIQGTMRDQCALVMQGLNTGSAEAQQATQQALGISDAQAATWKEQALTEWELLLQLDSYEDEAGMMWGDSGRLYFWIPRTALSAHDFSQVWQVLQCY